MKLKPLFLLFFVIFVNQLIFGQKYVDISLQDVNFSNCPPGVGFSPDYLIHPAAGINGKGIGWAANLYLNSETGGSNTIYDLTWIIGTNNTFGGNTYYFDNVDIWIYEYKGSQFTNNNRPAVETWTASASTPTDVTNVMKVISNGMLTVKDPMGGECVASTLNNLDIPYNYSGNNSLIIYIQKKTVATNSAGSNSAYPVFKHNIREGGTVKRRICNWEGTIASPLPSAANNSSTNKFARVVFNRSFTNTQVNASCSSTNKLTPCIPDCQSSGTNTTVTLCGSTTFTLINSVTSNTTATWVAAAGSPTLSGGYRGVFTTTNTGTYSYTYNIPVNGSCPTSSAVVTVSVLPKPAGTSTNVSICAGSTYSLFPLLNANSTSGYWSPSLGGGYMGVITPTASGSYTYKVSNSACNTFTSAVVTVSVLTLTTNVVNANCKQADGSAAVIAGGGVAPYSYLWSNGSTTANISNLLANTYSVTVTDANGCKKVAYASVTDIQGPTIILQSTSAVTCFGKNDGAATVTVTPGASPPPFNISWSDGHRTLNVTDFTSGLKILTLVDQAGCKASVAVDILEPKKLVSTILTPTHVTCFGSNNGKAIVSATDGTSPYFYKWIPSLQTSSVAINLSANIYTATVTDKNGCISSETININQPSKLNLNTPIISNINCFGKNDGAISAPAIGGNIPYTYNWSPGNFGNVSSIVGLAPLTYSLNLVDSKNCHVDTTFLIIEPSLLTSTYVSKPATCGLANGSATVIINGGTPIYTVSWNLPGSPTGNVAANMQGGNNWIATIRDSKGCLATQTVNIAKPPLPIILSSSATDPTCFGGADGTMSVTFGSGVAPYKVIWPSPLSQTVTPFTTTEHIFGVSAGPYNVVVQDANGCQATKTIVVSQPAELKLNTTRDTSICYGQSIQISANASGGTPPYSFIWNPNIYSGTGPHLVSPKTATSYSVIAQDSKGCFSNSSRKVLTINVLPPLTTSGNSVTTCHGQTTTLTPYISGVGNGGPYSYVGYPNGIITYTGSALTAQTTNTFGVTVTDGCTIPNSIAVFTITTNPLPTANFSANILDAFIPAIVTFSTSPATANTYTWTTNNNELIGTTSNTSYTFTLPGLYSINLAITNTVTGCSNNITKLNYLLMKDNPTATVKLQDSVTTASLKIYPNPANDLLHIELIQLQPSTEEYQITVENALGQLVYQTTTKAGKHSIQTDNFKTGVYFVKVQTTKGLMVEKVVIQ